MFWRLDRILETDYNDNVLDYVILGMSIPFLGNYLTMPLWGFHYMITF